MTALDVAFANLYFAAADAAWTPEAVPLAWRPLAERRSVAGIEPVQFALAGMNAMNHDLPLAVVNTCTALATAPDAGTRYADCERANAQLKTWHILRKLRCCPWRAGQLAKAIDVSQVRERGRANPGNIRPARRHTIEARVN